MVSDLEKKNAISETWNHIRKVSIYVDKIRLMLEDRALDHDMSKLKDPEIDIFSEYGPKLENTTYGSDEYKEFLKNMKPALDHHYKNNRHHPEFHENGIDDMNLIDIIEMLADWIASGKRHKDGDPMKSIEINKDRFKISPQLVSILKNTVRLLDKKAK